MIEVSRPADELFHFWRNFANLPRFMSRLDSVVVADSLYSRWLTRDGDSRTVAWDIEVTAEVPDHLIAWRSIGDRDQEFDGVVRFANGGKGLCTRVDLEFAFQLGTKAARLLGADPEGQIQADLMRFGEIVAGERALLKVQR